MRLERLPELTSGYELRNIWNMDELGLLFKALPGKGFVEKPRRCKRVKSLNNVLQQPFL